MSRRNEHPTRVGQRVDRTTGGKLGRVKWIGTPQGTTGTWVGVELENPDPRAGDGRFKDGTQYFECKNQHGFFQKAILMRVVPDSKKTRSKTDDRKQGKQRRRHPQTKVKKNRQTQEVSEEKEDPVPTKTFQSLGIQTELYEQNTFKIAQDIVAMNDRKMRLMQKERQDALAFVREKEAEIQSLKSTQAQKDYQIQMLTIEKENLIQQLDEAELKHEEAVLIIEQRNDDIEELQFQLEHVRGDIFSQLRGDEADMAALIEENQELYDLIDEMKRKAQEQLEEHLGVLLDLRSQVRLIPQMENRIDELLGSEREVIKLNSENMSLRSKMDELLITNNSLEELKVRNIEMDCELKDLREFVDLADDMLLVSQKLHEEDDAFIMELKEKSEETKREMSEWKKKSTKQATEIYHLQKENFEMGQRLEKFHFGLDGARDEDYNQIVLENERLKLDLKRAEELSASQVREVIDGRVAQVQRKLMKAYFPRWMDIETAAFHLISILERMYLKVDFIRDLMDRSLVDSEKSNEETATHARCICPMLIRQLHVIHRAQLGALTLSEERVDAMARKWSMLVQIENVYDNLLTACQDKNGLETFDADDLDKQEAKLIEFVDTYCALEREQKDEEANLFDVMDNLSVAKYRLMTVHQKLQEFRQMVSEKMAAENLVSRDDEKQDEGQQRELQIGIMEKMLRLQRLLSQDIQEVVGNVSIARIGFDQPKVNLEELGCQNLCGARMSQLKACKSIARHCVNRVNGMMIKLVEMNDSLEFDGDTSTIDLMNRILEDESEIEPNGVIGLLEKMVNILDDIRNDLKNENGQQETNTFVVTSWEMKAQEIRRMIEESENLKEEMSRMEKVLAKTREEKFEVSQRLVESKRKVATLMAKLKEVRKDVEEMSVMEQKVMQLETYRLENADLMMKCARLEVQNEGLLRSDGELRNTLRKLRRGDFDVEDNRRVMAVESCGDDRMEEMMTYSKMLEDSISSLRKKLTMIDVTKGRRNLRWKPLRKESDDEKETGFAEFVEIEKEIGKICATPKVVDVTNAARAKVGSSEIVGRQMKLKLLSGKLRHLRDVRGFVDPKREESSGNTVRIGAVELPNRTKQLPKDHQLVVKTADLERLTHVFSM